MEVLLLGGVFLLMSFVGYIIDKKIFNPLFIVPFVWGLILILFKVLPHQLYPLHGQFTYAILLWVCSFWLTGLLFINGNGLSKKTIYNKYIYNLYFYLIIIFAPLAIISLILEALKVGPEYFFLRLRMINTGLDEDDTFSIGKLAYVFNLTNATVLLYTLHYEKISKKKYYVLLLLSLLLNLITLARTSIVVLMISIFTILYIKGKLKSKHYIYFILAFFAFILLITGLRNSTDSSEESLSNILAVYLFSSLPAFETVTYSIPVENFGEYTFRFFYAVANTLGGNFDVKNTILNYVNVPVPTNVYTILYPFYKDFGYWGIGIFGCIYGIIYSLIYNNYKHRNEIFILLYSILYPFLLLQFFSEYVFSNLSTHLQFLIVILLPYYFRIKND